MNAPITPAVLEALARDYDELGFTVELTRSDLGTAVALDYRETGSGWHTIFAEGAEIGDDEEAARYRAEVDREAESAWRSQ